jgi:hypothetical protein
VERESAKEEPEEEQGGQATLDFGEKG